MYGLKPHPEWGSIGCSTEPVDRIGTCPLDKIVTPYIHECKRVVRVLFSFRYQFFRNFFGSFISCTLHRFQQSAECTLYKAWPTNYAAGHLLLQKRLFGWLISQFFPVSKKSMVQRSLHNNEKARTVSPHRRLLPKGVYLLILLLGELLLCSAWKMTGTKSFRPSIHKLLGNFASCRWWEFTGWYLNLTTMTISTPPLDLHLHIGVGGSSYPFGS